MSRENIDLYNTPKGDNIGGIRDSLIKLRGDFDAHIHDGSSSRSFRTLFVDSLVARGSTMATESLAVKKTSYLDNTAGFWVGLLGNVAKMYIGDATNNFKWSGTALTIQGGTLTAGIFQTAATGERLSLVPTGLDAHSIEWTNSSNFQSMVIYMEGVDGDGDLFFQNNNIGGGLGCKFQGYVAPSLTGAYDLGSSSLNWRQLYTKGITITQAGSAATYSLLINNTSTNISSWGLHVNRVITNAGGAFGAIIICTNNDGSAIGLDVKAESAGSISTGIRIAGTPNIGINLAAAAKVIKVTADATALGAYSGRIPIDVDGNLRYLAYYL